MSGWVKSWSVSRRPRLQGQALALDTKEEVPSHQAKHRQLVHACQVRCCNQLVEERLVEQALCALWAPKETNFSALGPFQGSLECVCIPSLGIKTLSRLP